MDDKILVAGLPKQDTSTNLKDAFVVLTGEPFRLGPSSIVQNSAVVRPGYVPSLFRRRRLRIFRPSVRRAWVAWTLWQWLGPRRKLPKWAPKIGR